MSPRASWGHAAALVLLSALLVGSVWVVPYLPTNDGPASVFAVHMENHFADPGTIYREVFAPAPQFAGRGFTVLFEPLEEALGWRRGLQVALSVIVLLEAWGLVALVRALEPRRLPLAFLAFPLALSWSLYMGFFAFVVSSGVGLFILAFAVARAPMTPGRRALVAGMLLLLAFLHMFPAIIVGSIIAAAHVASARRGKRMVELALWMLTGLPAAGLVLAAFLVARRVAATVPFSSTFVFTPVADVLALWPQTVVPGPLPRALAATALVLAGGAIALFRVARTGTDVRDRVISGAAILFLLSGIFGPTNIPGWQLFAPRFDWIGVALLVATLPFERIRSGRLAGAVTGLLLGVAVASCLVTYPFHRHLAAAVDDAIAGLSAPITRHGLVLPVNLEPQGPGVAESGVPMMVPLHQIGALYATAQGGDTPYTFASNPATWPFVVRPDGLRAPPVPPLEHYDPILRGLEFRTDRAFREQQEGELATFAMFYEGVLVSGARPEDHALWKRRGFVADWERGTVFLGHFEPCTVDLTLPPSAPAPLLDVGVGEKEIFADVRRPLGEGPAGAGRVAIDWAPCGRVWFRPHWPAAEVAAAPGPDPKHEVFCENSLASGKIFATVTRTGGHVECSGLRGGAAP